MQTKIESFGEVNFANAELGDARRSRRLAKTADLMCRRPGGSLPQKLNNPKDLKAFYRLVKRDEVTHEAILAVHREATRNKIDQTRWPVLILHNAMELDYTTHLSLDDDLGQIGNGTRRGYITQNSLAVNPKNRQILGLYNQVLHHRANVPDRETIAQKRERESRESLLWLRGTEPSFCLSSLDSSSQLCSSPTTSNARPRQVHERKFGGIPFHSPLHHRVRERFHDHTPRESQIADPC